MTLTEFLMARIDHDERAARKLAETDRRPVMSLATTINHPERLLAECEAKRRIIASHEAHEERVAFALDQELSPDHPDQRRRATHEVLRLLATVYADHPDYRAEWRV